MRAKLSVVGAGVGLLLAAMPVWAHHSFAAEFDADKPITLTGTVTKMEWVNPHAWIHMDVKGPDSKVVNWAIETSAVNAMFRRGFRKDSLLPGTELTVKGHLARNGEPKVSGNTVTFADGRTLFVGSSGTGAPADQP